MIPLARVKLGAAARTSLAAERSADGAPSLGATLALVDGALLVPQSTMHLMGVHAGQRVWVTDEARSWHALVHLWPADKLVKTGCRLLLPSHDSSPLQDGSRALVQPLLQPIYRATAVHLRPLANSAAAAPLLRDQGAISSKLRQLVTLLLSTVLASRDVFVGDEVCVAQFEQEFTFRVTAVDSADGKRTSEQQQQQPPGEGAATALPQLFTVSSSTRVLVSTPAASSPAASADSSASAFIPRDIIDSSAIGGLEKQIEKLNEMIQCVVDPRAVEYFESMNMKPPKGVLLYGPPGTGKTLLARSVAQQSSMSFYVINGPEIVSKYVGESEEKLSSVFALARRNAPSIIFIDEIDSLCPKREESTDVLQQRIVGSLLTLMDGNSGTQSGTGEDGSPSSSVNDRVFVIGATNRPDAIDVAMRRSGRFDSELEIGIPNADQRGDILTKILMNMPHMLTDEEIARVASVTHGFVGADLKALCREAGLAALARIQLQEGWVDKVQTQLQQRSPSAVSSSAPPALCLTHADFARALPSVKPSAMRSLVVDVPKVKWSDVGGQEDVKQRLKEAVEWPLKHPERYLQFGIDPPKGILLYGPPGTGKTLLAKALANEASHNFIAVKGPELFSKYVGESEKALREVFSKARANAPSIIFFDEIDSIAARRGEGGGGEGGERVAHRVLTQLLTEMDGIAPLKQVTILAATNRPDIIDPALLRPGRIDRILYVAPPDEASCAAMLKIEFKRIGTAADGLDVASLAQECANRGLSGAEISALCREAGMAAMEDDLHAKALTQKNFDTAFTRVTPGITTQMLQFYRDYAARATVASV